MSLSKIIGLTSDLINQTMRVGGIPAVRSLIRTHQKSVSRILHPDITGSKLPYYTGFMEACNAIDAMTDQNLWSTIKTKENKVEKPLQSYRSYFGEFVEASKNKHIVMPEQGELHIVSLISADKAVKFSTREKLVFCTLRATTDGIAFCKDRENEWQHEPGVYIFGALPRTTDNEIAKIIYPDSSQRGHHIPITGKTSEHGLIPRLPISSALINIVQAHYTQNLNIGNVLLVIDRNGQIYHFGYIAFRSKRDTDKEPAILRQWRF